MTDSAAVEPEALGAGVFDVDELLEAFRLDELVQDRALALRSEGDPLVGTFDPLLQPRFFLRIGDVHELDAERRAIGAAEDLQHLADRREFEPEHVVDENLAVVVGLGEAVARRVQLLVVAAAGSGRADRDWRGDGRASDRRGSSSGRGANRASPGRPPSPRLRRRATWAPALILSPSWFSTGTQFVSNAATISPFATIGQSFRCHFGPRASAIAAPFGSFSVAKKLCQPASTEFGCS